MCCASTSSPPVRSGGVSCGVVGDRADRGVAFQHLEAVGRNQDAARRLVVAVVGAADALQQPRGALRRTDVDDEVDVAPVDAEIERRRAHHRAQPPGRHRVLDLAALRHVERAVMQRDRKPVVVDAPQRVEDHLGLAAGVDEHERGLVPPDQLVDRREGVARGVAGPGQVLARLQHRDVRLGAARGDDQIGAALRHARAAARDSGRGPRARPPSPTARWSQAPARGETAAQARATGDRRACLSTSACSSSSTTRRSCRTGTAHPRSQAAAQAAPAW